MPRWPLPFLLLIPALFVSAAAQETTPTLKSDTAPTTLARRLETQFDVNRHMVAIEALVVEINEDRTRDLGLTYGFSNAAGEAFRGGNIGLGRSLEPVRVPVLIGGPNGATRIGSEPRLPGLGISLTGMNIGSGVLSARLRALLEQGDAAIRTRPVAVALNRTPVTIEAINEVPYLDYKLDGKQKDTRFGINYEKVGVILNVTPEIVNLQQGIATLDISNIEVSSVSNFVTTNNVERPVFNRSATHTRVTLGEGETFVVGGLKTRRVVHQEDRVPILGRIPLLGRLFTSQRDLERNMDVLFFITPNILAPGENFLLPFDFRNQQALGFEVAPED